MWFIYLTLLVGFTSPAYFLLLYRSERGMPENEKSPLKLATVIFCLMWPLIELISLCLPERTSGAPVVLAWLTISLCGAMLGSMSLIGEIVHANCSQILRGKLVTGWIVSWGRVRFYQEIGYPREAHGWNFCHFVSGVHTDSLDVVVCTGARVTAKMFVRATDDCNPLRFESLRNDAKWQIEVAIRRRNLADSAVLTPEELAMLPCPHDLRIQLQHVLVTNTVEIVDKLDLSGCAVAT